MMGQDRPEPETFSLGGTRGNAEALRHAKIGDALTLLRRDDGGVDVHLSNKLIGSFTSRHAVARKLVSGEQVLHASVNSIGSLQQNGASRVTVRVVTGVAGMTYHMPPHSVREYSIRVAGVSYRQEEIKRCRIGDAVSFSTEQTNAYDRRAIAITARGMQIGYLPNDSWLTSVILDERKVVDGVIEGIAQSPSGDLGVVVRTTLR